MTVVAADAFTADSVLHSLSAQMTELAVLRLNSASDPMLRRFQSSFDQPALPHHMAVLDVSSQQLSPQERKEMTVQKVSAFLINSFHKTLLRTELEQPEPAAADEQLLQQRQEDPPVYL